MSTVHHLSARGLCKSYRKKQVVTGVDIDLFSGECIGLLGPNGAGKTTSFYMVCGLIAADSGQVSLDDLDITRQTMHLMARRGIGYLPQDASIFRKLTVAENLLAIFETLDIRCMQIGEGLGNFLFDLGFDGVKD